MKRKSDGTIDGKALVLGPRKKVKVRAHSTVSNEIQSDNSHIRALPQASVATSEAHVSARAVLSGAHDEEAGTFDSKHFDFLSLNEKFRYFPNSRRVAHAVIFSAPDGNKTALQYALPMGLDPTTPTVCQLSSIEETLIGGKMIRYKARSLDGGTWHSNRFVKAQVKLSNDDPIDVEIAYFSEDDEKYPEVFWGSVGEVARFSGEAQLAFLQSPVFKGGTPMVVEPDSVRYRDLHPQRSISQNKIMGDASGEISARDAYEEYSQRMDKHLSPEMKRILQRGFGANIRRSPENQFRPEWNHADAHGLTPLSKDPQLRSNLGAAGKWFNTEMMLLERIAKWFTLNHAKNTRITIQSLFEMLHQSELINKAKQEVNIEFNERFVRFMQDLDAFKDKPVFRKASDVAQATGIGYAMLHDHTPIFREMLAKSSAGTVVQSVSMEAGESKDNAASDAQEETIYRDVPESFSARTSIEAKQYTLTFIDMETMGRRALQDEIIEIALLSCSFTMSEGILAIIDQYDDLQDPGKPLPTDIAKLTHIGDEIRGKSIRWDRVNEILKKSDYILCHNSNFDRRFLEHQTPRETQDLIRSKPFGCTMRDIDWKARGFPSRALKLINQHLGFKYEGHRALNDCWATLNLLREVDGALNELMKQVNKTQTLLYVTDSPFDKRKLLKDKDYKWSNGSEGTIPKCWYKYVWDDAVQEEKNWLDESVYGCEGASNAIPWRVITAVERYSVRSTQIERIVKLDTTARKYFDARMRGSVSKGLQDKILNVAGLSQAIQLYALSAYGYEEGRRSLFYMIARVLANPLCQTIYGARLRGFSDYCETAEPLTTTFARNLIWQLSKVDEHERVGVFFNALAEVCPFPPSQKYIIEVDVEQYVLGALDDYCLSTIKTIKTIEDFEKTRNMIRLLKTVGGDKTIFDAIKYSVGTAIESEDWASTRNYPMLMEEIWHALAKPHPFLSDFKKELEASKGYQLMASRAIRVLSPIMGSAAPRREGVASQEINSQEACSFTF